MVAILCGKHYLQWEGAMDVAKIRQCIFVFCAVRALYFQGEFRSASRLPLIGQWQHIAPSSAGELSLCKQKNGKNYPKTTSMKARDKK